MQVKHSEGAILQRSHYQVWISRVEGHSIDWPPHLPGVHFLAGGGLPPLQGAVLRATEHPAPIRAEGTGQDTAAVPNKAAHFTAARDFPQHQESILRCRESELPIGR